MLAGSSFIVLTVDGRHAPIGLRSAVTRFATSLGGDREWRVVERLEELAPQIGRIRPASRARPVERQRYGPSFGQQQCTDQVADVVRQPRFEMIETHAVDARLARSPYYFDANQGSHSTLRVSAAELVPRAIVRPTNGHGFSEASSIGFCSHAGNPGNFKLSDNCLASVDSGRSKKDAIRVAM